MATCDVLPPLQFARWDL